MNTIERAQAINEIRPDAAFGKCSAKFTGKTQQRGSAIKNFENFFRPNSGFLIFSGGEDKRSFQITVA